MKKFRKLTQSLSSVKRLLMARPTYFKLSGNPKGICAMLFSPQFSASCTLSYSPFLKKQPHM
jgi:hypothetical protein